eukprot:COSAG02_NODE_1304_length_13353_cov_92.513883_2_plen_157_part_00
MDRQLDILRCCVGVDRSMQNAFGKAHGSLEQLQIFEVLVAISYVLQANAFYRYTSRAADAVNGARVQHISIAVATINCQQKKIVHSASAARCSSQHYSLRPKTWTTQHRMDCSTTVSTEDSFDFMRQDEMDSTVTPYAQLAVPQHASTILKFSPTA